MYHALVPFCTWLQNRSWALYLSGSTWTFPYIQLLHYTGLSIWLGTTILVDLRFLGWVKGHNPGKFARELVFLNWTGLCIAVTGGFLLFSGSAASYIQNIAFEIKFPILLFGICYHAVLQTKEKTWGRMDPTPGVAKLAVFFEMLIWISVVTAATRIPNN